jgi:hypothetical protein
MAGRGGPQAGVSEPSEQGSRAGPGDLWVVLAQGDPDQDRPPAGVFPALGQGRLTDLGQISLRQPRGHVIVRSQAFWTSLPESLEEVTDGAGREAEGRRQGGGAFPPLSALK